MLTKASSRCGRRDRAPGAYVGALVGAVSLCICCEGAEQPARAPEAPASSLSPYAGHVTELFDDVIEPEAVGRQGSDSGDSRKNDALLRERTQTGDAVVRARVVTVTSEPESQGDGWRLGLRPLETLAGKHPPEGEFTFVVEGKGPAAGIVRTLEARLVGATFVVFVRTFGHVDTGSAASSAPGAAELHFHIAKDDKDELGAVREASLLGEVR
jgi:hypothetical protein